MAKGTRRKTTTRQTKKAGGGRTKTPKQAETYKHPEADSPMRPEVGTQAQFRKKKPPKTYRYDSSLSPELNWDGQNAARELGEWLLARIDQAAALDPPHAFPEPQIFKAADRSVLTTVGDLRDAVEQLKRLGQPFLNWAGKAERLSFDVPTLPLFIHERLSTKAIIETLRSHKRDKQMSFGDLFNDPQHSITDQVLKAYEYRDNWVNRMILGDSLVVMNSLLEYEGLGGQVQMIYMDPPYGVRFGSNFQPFVRKRDVTHNDDDDMTREPEMVHAYRDTWEMGLHSYLSYMRDRLLLCQQLLHPTGSIFVQISDENVHHVREVLDEVFGPENFVALIPFRKKTMPLGTVFLEQMSDFILWYARQARDSSGKRFTRFHRLYLERSVEGEFHHCWYELPDGSRHRMSKPQLYDHSLLPPHARVYRLKSLEPSGPMSSGMYGYEFDGRVFPHPKNGWGVTRDGMDKLVAAKRIQPEGNRVNFIMYADEGSATQLTAPWTDTVGAYDKTYVVQTNTEVIRRCMLMTTNPGDLVLDPTCGSGTTPYVAEQWGRRWIAIDVSRVPLALAHQRLLTSTYPYYQLRDESRGPVGGFVYIRKQNSRGREIGGVVPHITVSSIANDEPPKEEVLVDRPEPDTGIVRVTGPFTFEATIPIPIDWEGDGIEDSGVSMEEHASFVDRMLEVLRKSPVLRLEGNRTVKLSQVRPPTKALSLSAEALVDNGVQNRDREGADHQSPERKRGVADARGGPVAGAPDSDRKPVAILFGPENGSVSENLVYEAAREAHAKNYTYLYVIGFGIQPHARKLVENCHEVMGIPASYIQMTPDVMMGDLLKNMRSSQIFSVCGLPEIKVRPADPDAVKTMWADPQQGEWYQVELLGLDVFDPATMEVDHRPGNDVPAWLLDTDYNDLCFHVCQAFFPRTSAWESLKAALKGAYEESVWDHLAGTKSAPFEPGDKRQIAVKVIDDRGNELLVTEKLAEMQP